MSEENTKTSWIPALAATVGMVLVTMDIFMKPVAKTALEKAFGVDAAAVQVVRRGLHDVGLRDGPVRVVHHVERGQRRLEPLDDVLLGQCPHVRQRNPDHRPVDAPQSTTDHSPVPSCAGSRGSRRRTSSRRRGDKSR